MRFLFLTSTPLNPIHGSGTYVGISTLVRALEKLGHSVEILAPHFWCPNFVLRRYLFNRFLSFQIPLSPRGGEGQGEGGIFDVIVGFDCDGFYWAKRGRFYKKRTRFFFWGGLERSKKEPGSFFVSEPSPYVVSLKGILADEARQERGLIRKVLEIQAKWEKINVQSADLVLVTSEYCQGIAQEMYQIPSEKIRIVPELIDIEEWEKLVHSHAERGTHTLSPTVLTVCRMYPRKNLGLLLRAWVRVREEHPNAQLRIVGTGQEYLRWKRLARTLCLGLSVGFLGDLTRDELAQEYKNCDIFCLPSRQEGFGIVFLEAMAFAKPIVAANAAAIPEIVHHKEHGLLINPDSETELSTALLQLIESPQVRQHLGENGRQWVRRFEASRVAGQFLKGITR